jgi:ketosteroid isomerase-like protein
MVVNSKASDLVHKYWELMMTNDFRSVGSLLSDDFVLDWPQTNERIRGRTNLAAMNEEYPAHGRWRFTLHTIVGNELEAVSEVSVTDGVQHARVISFFTIIEEKIARMVEYWPEQSAAPENRKHLVEKIEVSW